MPRCWATLAVPGNMRPDASATVTSLSMSCVTTRAIASPGNAPTGTPGSKSVPSMSSATRRTFI